MNIHNRRRHCEVCGFPDAKDDCSVCGGDLRVAAQLRHVKIGTERRRVA